MCCGIQRMFKVTTNMVEAQCGKDVLDEGGMMIGMSFSALSDVFCRGYEPESPKCSGILPPSGTPSKGSESKLQLIQFLNTAISNLQ
uniref:Putative secreted salivary gland peptide n=1 Tax=Dolomedes sulfureus TaxID=492288 RepID=A0A0P0CW33_9ARAC|nr:putative secreted salivary gland peptide [Dolomedes sulfureus]